MDEILKSEIFIVVYGKKEGILFEEFGGLFRQVHGYNLKLSNYGYLSLRNLLNDMNDLVELKTINGQNMIRCKSPSRHHVVVSIGNNSSQPKEQVAGPSSIPLPSSGSSQGPVVRKTEQAQPPPLQQNHVKQVNNTNSPTGKKSKETSKPKCSLPAKNTDPAVSHKNSFQPLKCGISSNKKTATMNATTQRHGSSARPKPTIPNPIHARSAGNVAIAAGAAKTNDLSKTRKESNSKSSNPKSERNLTQNVKSAKTRAMESKAFLATVGPNKKAGLLPTPKTPLKSSPFNVNKSQFAQHGIRPNISYASVCASNVNKNQFNHNGQQFTPNRQHFAPNNIRFNVDTTVNSTNVTQSYSRAEPRTSIQSISVIKKNIQVLLTQHATGLSVFQLQKIYLFTFQHPLKLKGSTTVKQLLLELKDMVKTEGVGVQMLVFPVPAENNPTTAANGNHDAALQGTGFLFTKKDFQKEVVLNPHSSDSLKTQSDNLQEAAQLPFQHQIDPMERHIAKVVKIEHKPPTSQNMRNVENIPSSAHYVEPPRQELSIPASDASVLPNHINEKPQHKVPPSALMHHQMYNSHSKEEMSYLCKNVILKETTTKNGPLQNAPQDSNLSHNKASKMDLADTTSSLTEQKIPYHSNNMLNGPEHSQQKLSDANSSMLLHDTKPHQFLVPHEENMEHLLFQPNNSMNTMETYGQTESPPLRSTGNFQPANNCNITEDPPSHSIECLQTKTALVQTEKPSSIQKCNLQNRKKLKLVAYSSSNSQEKAPNSQIINNLASKGKANDVQSKDVNEKILLQEASVSSPTNDLCKANTHDVYVHGTEQAASMSSDIHKVDNIHNSKREENKSTLPTNEFTTDKRITQTSLSSSRPKQELVDLPKNIPTQPKISVAKSEFQNNSESMSEQEDMTTWQTSQGQVCCIL